jgi:hypothetical protein
MDSDLECIYEYATRQGGVRMAEICLHNRYNGWYCQMERAQDAIGWWHFMERMVCNKIQAIQTTYLALSRSPTSAEEWMVELITKLLQVTHGQCNSNSNLSCTLPLGLIASGEGRSANPFLPKKLIGLK